MRAIPNIQAMNAAAAQRAAKEKLLPLIVEQEDKRCGDRLVTHLRNLPNLGTYCPEGWRLEQQFLVDTSDTARRGEEALTYVQFLLRVQVGRGYAIVELKPPQQYVGEFAPVEAETTC